MSRRLGQSGPESEGMAESRSRTVHDLFGEVVSRDRDGAARPAILCGDNSVSYADLDARSNRLARYLGAKGVGPGSRVAIFLHRSPEAVTAMLGILKAGAAFVPLDPSYPADHLTFIAEDAQPAAVVSAAAMAVAGAGERGASRIWGAAAPTILLDAESGAIDRESTAPLAAGAGPDDLAYVMYTSGTTGRPKGVMVPHRGVVRLARNHFVELGPSDVVLQLAPLAFDASTFEIWGALLNGAALAVVASPRPSFAEIGEALARHKATTAWLTASLFHAVVDRRIETLRPLRQLIAGGDVLSPRHVRRVLDQLPDCRLVNGYGPTENTTFTCCYTIPKDARADAPVPIGAPIDQTQVHILDENLCPVASGAVGELFASGEGVALGYLNRPDLTAEKFLADRFSAEPGKLMYRTGDLVRQRADGVLEFVGRADRQVKINGKRVELDEVEAAIRRLPEVADAAAVLRARREGERHIVAYVAAHPGAALEPGALRAQMRRLLPEHMAPAQFIVLDSLPLTPTGKIDRDALPAPQASPAAAPSPAMSEVEARLAAIWRKLLKVEIVGLDANFFDLGGSSLDLMALHEEIRAQFADEVPMTALFEHTTIRTLAARLEKRGSEQLPIGEINERKARQSEALRRISQRRAMSAQ